MFRLRFGMKLEKAKVREIKTLGPLGQQLSRRGPRRESALVAEADQHVEESVEQQSEEAAGVPTEQSVATEPSPATTVEQDVEPEVEPRSGGGGNSTDRR